MSDAFETQWKKTFGLSTSPAMAIAKNDLHLVHLDSLRGLRNVNKELRNLLENETTDKARLLDAHIEAKDVDEAILFIEQMKERDIFSNGEAVRMEHRIERLKAGCLKIGPWMSAALEDEAVCQEMKDDIRTFFEKTKGEE